MSVNASDSEMLTLPMPVIQCTQQQDSLSKLYSNTVPSCKDKNQAVKL
jgi:hypothetical protein